MTVEKKAVVTIGYREYAMSMADAAKIMAIAQKAVAVEREGFRGPFEPAEENEPFAGRMEVASVLRARRERRIPESHRIGFEPKRIGFDPDCG